MGWFKEMETPEWSEYAHRRIEEEAQHHAEYLREKQVRDFEDFVTREEKKKAVTRTA